MPGPRVIAGMSTDLTEAANSLARVILYWTAKGGINNFNLSQKLLNPKMSILGLRWSDDQNVFRQIFLTIAIVGGREPELSTWQYAVGMRDEGAIAWVEKEMSMPVSRSGAVILFLLDHLLSLTPQMETTR